MHLLRVGKLRQEFALTHTFSKWLGRDLKPGARRLEEKIEIFDFELVLR